MTRSACRPIQGWACPRCGSTGYVAIDGILRCGNAGCANTDEYDPADGERLDYARLAMAQRLAGRCSCQLAIPGVLPDRIDPLCPEHAHGEFEEVSDAQG